MRERNGSNGEDAFPELGIPIPTSVRLIGATTLATTGQHAPFHMELSAGLNVLYGLNGSGKSRTLQMLNGLFGVSDAPESRPFAQVHVESPSDMTIQSALDEDGLLNFLGQTSQLVLDACVERLVDWDSENWAHLVDMDEPDGRVTAGSTLAGATAALLIDAGLPVGLATEIGKAGQFLLRPAEGPGAEVYIGLPLQSSALADWWAVAAEFYPKVASLPPTEDPGEYSHYYWTRNNYEWLEHDLRPDWSALIQAEWLAARRKGVTFGVCALAYVLGHIRTRGAIPAWVALPMYRLGVIYTDRTDWQWDFGVVTDTAGDPTAAYEQVRSEIRGLAVTVAEASNIPVLEARNGHVSVSTKLASLLADVSDEASRGLRMVLGPSAPELVIEIDPEGAVKSGTAVRVWAFDEVQDAQLEIIDLSEAFRRWALISLRLVLAQHRLGGARAGLLLLDEPDASLHVIARRALASGLKELVAEGGLTAIVASHALEMIDTSGARLWHAERVSGKVRLIPVSEAELSQMHPTVSGLSKADVLLLTKLWVVVEGEHDEVVLKAWLGETFASPLIRVVPMRGTHNAMGILDSQLILNATDARVVVVTDGTRASLADELNAALRSVAEEPVNRDDALRRLAKRTRGNGLSPEERVLAELATAAIKNDAAPRLAVFGLSKPDIIQYLPAEDFVPGATWDVLVGEWKRSARSTPFKDWLRSAKSAKINAPVLKTIVEKQDSVPPELSRLARWVTELSGTR